MQVEELLHSYFRKRQEVVLVYLFGSYVNPDRKLVHDIDIGLFVNPSIWEALERDMPYGYGSFLSTELAHLLHFDGVDVAILNNAPPLLLRRVIGTGKLIFRRSELDRVRFEVESLKRYSDTAQIRKIKKSYMQQRIKEGLSAYG